MAIVTATPHAGAVSVEVERKYLLRTLPPLPGAAAVVRIEQGWLPGSVIRERLRRAIRSDGQVHLTRTIKAGAGVSRLELEEPVSQALFDALWPLTQAQRVRKLRHQVPEGPLVWEVDQFLDRDLVLAEVELPSADAAVPLPAWLAPVVVREVTDEATYVNANLAQPDLPPTGSAA